ncbi:TVP38/TMEM64 family protein [Methylomonas koyamae]|uniref:TVP38/TMEM64 family protein n=1 Tax=Methylomonas koyamae TaxID=702114 RepID=UPI002872D106|nr:VTT domain-containing protein [Methylomonas koyamae]WNB75983.1 VTT domain-containing protein [Methylomonas koyamae]
MPSRSKIFATLLVLALCIAAFRQGTPGLQDIQFHKQAIGLFIGSHYGVAVALFFALCVIFINSPLPLAAAMKILSGYFFGFYLGAVYNVGATVLACLVGFWLSRYAFRRRFEQLFYARLESVEHEIERNGLYYFLSLRVAMVVPYFLINIVAGLSRLSFRDYLLSTLLGVLPASLIYANGGQRLEQIRSAAELFEWQTAASLALVAAASLLPAWLRRGGRRSN